MQLMELLSRSKEVPLDINLFRITTVPPNERPQFLR